MTALPSSYFAHLPRRDPVALCKAWIEENQGIRGFHVKAAAGTAGGADVELAVFDPIGSDYWGAGVTAKAVKAALDQHKDLKTVRVMINSPGGDVSEGMAIYNELRACRASVRTEVVGLAASAASWVAQAGDTRIVHQPSMTMVHGAWMVTRGNGDAHQKSADLLAKLDQEQVDMFARRTGLGKDELAAMLKSETWMGAEEACSKGFADSMAHDEPAHPDNPGDDDDDESMDGSVSPGRWSMFASAVPFKKHPLRQDSGWNGPAAVERIKKWASSDGSGKPETINWSKYKQAFAWFDSAKPKEFGSYKLPHHDVVNGKLITSRAGVIAAGNSVAGSRGGVDIPSSDLPAVKAHLAAHYHEFGMKAPWETSKSSAALVATEKNDVSENTDPKTETTNTEPSSDGSVMVTIGDDRERLSASEVERFLEIRTKSLRDEAARALAGTGVIVPTAEELAQIRTERSTRRNEQPIARAVRAQASPVGARF